MTYLDYWRRVGGSTQLGRFSIDTDRWDLKRFDAMLSEMRQFKTELQLLRQTAPDTATGLWGDTFQSLYQVDPQLVEGATLDPRYRINHKVMQTVMAMPERERLVRWTRGDEATAAGACIAIRPDLERIYDECRTADKLAEELAAKLAELAEAMASARDLDDLIADWSKMHDPDEPDPEMDELRQEREALQVLIDQLTIDAERCDLRLEDELANVDHLVGLIIRTALGRQADSFEQTAILEQMWGSEPGSLQRLPAEMRMKLAKRMDTDAFRRMAELFGTLKRLMDAEQRNKITNMPEEVVDVTLGSDLERVLPSALSALNHPLRNVEFLRDFAEGRLLVYEMEGHEKLARGGIVCCIDNSGSMVGDHEVWAKAVALCLLNLAITTERKFWGIHFGSAHELMEFDFSNGRPPIERVLDFAEFFFGGGTSFTRPLTTALDHLSEQHEIEGAVDADIVFITDGLCNVPEKWKQEWIAERERIGASCWGIIIGGHKRSQPLYDLCDGKVATIPDILNAPTGGEIREVFAGV